MTGNRDLPAPRKGASSVVDICMGVAADIASVASAGGLPTNAALEMIKAYKQKRIEAAQRILIEQVRAGRADLNEEEFDELVPIAYHFFRAAEEGEAARTLRIFARLIAGQIEAATVDSSSFAFAARTLEGLPDRELNLLVKYLHHTQQLRGETQGAMQVQKRVEADLVPTLYVSSNDISAAASLLAGRGLLLGIDSAMLGGGLTHYFASPLATTIEALAKNLE